MEIEKEKEKLVERLKGDLLISLKDLEDGKEPQRVIEDLGNTFWGAPLAAVPHHGHPVEQLCPATCGRIREFFNECYELFLVKQNDRGPGNISQFGRKGIVLRICDKYSRIKRIIWDEIVPEVSEPVENEYMDLAVYSAIDYTLSKEDWGK
jgi:hypothetical protein